MLLTYTAAISAANTPRWADNGTKTAPIEMTDTMEYDSIKWSETPGKERARQNDLRCRV